MNQALYNFLDENGLSYEKFTHPPVFTCEEARALSPDLPGAETKNLFLCDDKGRRHFLAVVSPDLSVDLKALAAYLGVKRLRFASAERLHEHLGVEPGSVTLLAVFNDAGGAVEVCIDASLWAAGKLLCHPLVNTETLSLPRTSVERFLALTNHVPQVFAIPAKPD